MRNNFLWIGLVGRARGYRWDVCLQENFDQGFSALMWRAFQGPPVTARSAKKITKVEQHMAQSFLARNVYVNLWHKSAKCWRCEPDRGGNPKILLMIFVPALWDRKHRQTVTANPRASFKLVFPRSRTSMRQFGFLAFGQYEDLKSPKIRCRGMSATRHDPTARL